MMPTKSRTGFSQESKTRCYSLQRQKDTPDLLGEVGAYSWSKLTKGLEVPHFRRSPFCMRELRAALAAVGQLRDVDLAGDVAVLILRSRRSGCRRLIS
jgi:hypothetical protein